jgi:hypothetical protein
MMCYGWPCVIRIITTIAVLGLCGAARAVDPIGPAKRIDVDPGSPIHRFGIIYVIGTAPGGFAVAWEEDNEAPPPPLIYEDIRFRIYSNTFAPVAGPRSANLTGDKRLPTLSRIVPLGTDGAYLVYAMTRDNNNPDHPEVVEAFGQTIALATGNRTGPRRLLNTVGISDTFVGIASGLSDGRAVFAWREIDGFDPTHGRFISSAGVPQPVNLDFVCCDSNSAQITSLQPLGNNFVATYLRRSIFGGSGIYGRVFRPNGEPLGAAKLLITLTSTSTPPAPPTPKVLSNGRVVAFEYVQVSSDRFKLNAQLYRQDWTEVGAVKTLVSNLTTTKYIDFAPTLDGGLFMIRTIQNGSVFTRSVRKLNAALQPEGPDYNFASPHGFDFFRIAAVTGDRAVVVYRNTVGGDLATGRHQLFARIVSY